MKTRFPALLLLVLLTGCATPKRNIPPAPPAIQQSPRPKPAPAADGDLVVRNCTVTHEAQGKANCICRRAVTHIDAKNGNKASLECR